MKFVKTCWRLRELLKSVSLLPFSAFSQKCHCTKMFSLKNEGISLSSIRSPFFVCVWVDVSFVSICHWSRWWKSDFLDNCEKERFFRCLYCPFRCCVRCLYCAFILLLGVGCGVEELWKVKFFCCCRCGFAYWVRWWVSLHRVFVFNRKVFKIWLKEM